MSTSSSGASSRERILQRLRDSLAQRGATPHPGPFTGDRPSSVPAPLEGFRQMFEAAGGEVVRLPNEEAARRWVAELEGPRSVVLGTDVSDRWAPALPRVEAADAELGISLCRLAIAETGTLVLDSRGGRRSQLLAPTHVVVVKASDLVATLAEALGAMQSDLPSALGLHSGPSKSADIGQVMVRGVHGPGRVVALVVGDGEA